MRLVIFTEEGDTCHPEPVSVLLTPVMVLVGARAFRTMLKSLLHNDVRIVEGIARLGVVAGDPYLPFRVLITVPTVHPLEDGVRLLQSAVGNTESPQDSLVVLPSQQNPRKVQAVLPMVLPLVMAVGIVTGVEGIPTLTLRLVEELANPGFY